MAGFPVKNRGSLPSSTLDAITDLATRMRALFLVEHSEDGTHLVTNRDLAFTPVGSMLDWPTTTAPSGWKICDGAQLNRVTYKALFDVIGATYGAGDGSTTFNLPDARGRFALSKAASGTGSTIGATGGALDHDHTMGAHTHSISSDGAHTHTGPSHTHTGPSHTHTGPSHTHTFTGTTDDDNNSQAAAPAAGVGFSRNTHQHPFSGTTAASGTGNTGASGTGNTGASGTGNTSSNGAHDHGAVTGSASGTSGANNPAFIVLGHTIIFVGVAA